MWVVFTIPEFGARLEENVDLSEFKQKDNGDYFLIKGENAIYVKKVFDIKPNDWINIIVYYYRYMDNNIDGSETIDSFSDASILSQDNMIKYLVDTRFGVFYREEKRDFLDNIIRLFHNPNITDEDIYDMEVSKFEKEMMLNIYYDFYNGFYSRGPYGDMREWHFSYCFRINT